MVSRSSASWSAEHFDVRLGFHPHVDTHVDTQVFIDKFLDDTDPEFVSLCLDTGHVEYCSGHNRDIIGRHPDRISYIHLKQVNPRVAAQAREERVGFYEAVQRGAMVEPPLGVPAMATAAQRPRGAEPRSAADDRTGHVSGAARQRQGHRGAY